MTNLRMVFYDMTTGVEFTVPWRDLQEFNAARQFLDQLTGGSYASGERRPFYVLEDDQQVAAFRAFRRGLRD